jgi:two-component system LytT family response regulator
MTNALHVRTALFAWGLFLAGTCAYCLTYQALVWAVTPDVTHTVTLALREWGAWLLVTPLVFGSLSRSAGQRGRLRERAVIAALAIAATALVPVAVDLATHTRGLPASLAIFLPRNVLAFAVTCLVWQVFVRRAEVVSTPAPAMEPATSAAPEPAAPTLPDALLVSKGADQCLVAVDRVQRVSAAGNYVEVHASGQVYLLRATLGQAQMRLPGARFVRIHRSHIVAVDEIERIRVQRSGSGVVVLRDGSSLPISKRYRAALQRLRAPATAA